MTKEASDLWYKDAIIYQVHLRAFCDSTADGVGDLRGLMSKLDYIQDLGATAIWILPFFPSPLRDDGYDIADYLHINPSYGTLQDFKALLRAAHARGLKVIIELVLNHTSEAHPWFQRARRAKPGSRYREFYVWSDAPTKYQDARIIFKDFEQSNWTWDPLAGAYYWHRFYHHQPDLNYENPEVKQAVLAVLDHWLSMGVDGLRLDAVPYLFEREGTNCENLPETHALLKEIRAHVDRHYPGRMLLAEANQWPEDAVAYFGQGDECHAAFHFPVMPRMFMALQMEDRFPIIDIMQQTPEIPEVCQWFTFLRNHDELTLEMVTDEERDYMYSVYAHNPQARINLGIRRRLTPLLGGNRRKIELLNCLLLSLPGTPVIYYGDEIGMGDNIYLGDRNGVRTPMQWSPDRNAGFSAANPQQLFLPVNIDHEYHYEAVNVENSQRNPFSLFWWMKRLIAMRQQTNVFSRGSLRFLLPENNRVLAYLRSLEGQTILVVANLSRFSQFVELDLSGFRGCTPVELFGQTPFPRIGELPYLLTLGPHSFYWFSLQSIREPSLAVTEPAPAVGQTAEHLPALKTTGSWRRILEGRARESLARLLPDWLGKRRWFSGKAKSIRSASIADVLPLDSIAATTGRGFTGEVALVVVQVEYVNDFPETYLLPVGFATERHAANLVGDNSPALLATLQVTAGDDSASGVLYDAFGEEGMGQVMLDMIGGRRRIPGRHGRLAGHPLRAYRALRGSPDDRLAVRALRVEQSNSTVIYGDRLLLKMFRRIEEGTNPDLELGRFLTETAHFPHTPLVAGYVDYVNQAGQSSTVGILQALVRNEGDAWNYTLESVHRFFERVLTTRRTESPAMAELPVHGIVAQASEPTPPQVRELCNAYLESAALLGQRTAEMHLALAAAAEDPQFAPEPFSELYQRSLYQGMRSLARKTLRMLRSKLSDLPAEVQDDARTLMLAEQELVDRFRTIVGRKLGGARIRCHGDYHLGQVLFTGKDFVIIDFEGEPARRLTERRIKRSPLRDVAGMIRSFDYAAQTVLLDKISGIVQKEELPVFRDWARFWSQWVSTQFVAAYLGKVSLASFATQGAEEVKTLLDVFLLEKAVYELAYELNNRPTWVRVPLSGILRLLDSGA
ncbi:MAG TPA: maltose alpha-D-glucosyltransferase [Pirellulaceae bacterium]|nr:maltose alpha-D-glucosyltransferase [Pirellulaceae bacterium]